MQSIQEANSSSTNAGATSAQDQSEPYDVLMLEVDTSTMCRFIHNSGFARQKLLYKEMIFCIRKIHVGGIQLSS
jgi:hypothetical protein